jgi:hypothetical protein
MSGDTIVARFDTVLTADTSSRLRVRQIVALGNARSYYQMKSSKGPQTEPSVNYVRGRNIDIEFVDKKVATVTVTDKATGVMIEPVAQAPAGKTAPTATPPKPAAPKPAAAIKPSGVRK